MKALVLILILIAAGVLAHNYLQTGEIGFNVSVSEEQLQIRDLEERLSDAARSYRVAGRATAIGGLAPDDTVESAAADVREIEREVEALRRKIREGDDLYPKLQALERKLLSTKREIGIP